MGTIRTGRKIQLILPQCAKPSCTTFDAVSSREGAWNQVCSILGTTHPYTAGSGHQGRVGSLLEELLPTRRISSNSKKETEAKESSIIIQVIQESYTVLLG
jgi:hypothetical protein